MAVALGVLYAFLIVARAVLATRHAHELASGQPTAGSVTILQPILSGDPLLEGALAANLKAHPGAEFLWLIDHDDTEAQRIANYSVESHPNLRVISGPGPCDGENPKLAKLIRALPFVDTTRLIVLDDDTFLPPESRLPAHALTTGLPVFSSSGTIYERFTGGFVNGNALLTYLSAARLRLQRTINGMIYSVDTAQLRALGGFAAAGQQLTDDYAVARLYLRQGLPITQAVAPAHVSMTIATFSHYVRVMRRWMIFASHYFRDNVSFSTIFWIGLPGLLPLAGLITGIVQGQAIPWTGLLIAKAILNRILLWRIARVSSTAADVFFECAADLLTPLWRVLAFIQPNRLTWRTRSIELSDGGSIRYK